MDESATPITLIDPANPTAHLAPTNDDLQHVHGRINELHGRLNEFQVRLWAAEGFIRDFLHRAAAVVAEAVPTVDAVAHAIEIVAPPAIAGAVAAVDKVIDTAAACALHPTAPQGAGGCTAPGCTTPPAK